MVLGFIGEIFHFFWSLIAFLFHFCVDIVVTIVVVSWTFLVTLFTTLLHIVSFGRLQRANNRRVMRRPPIEAANEEIAFHADIRKKIADSWENYACADEAPNATEPKKDDERWRGRRVSIMVDLRASRIHTIDDFLSPEECDALEAAAAPRLRNATVADGSGGSHLSESRKAKQTGIRVNWRGEAEGNLAAWLSRRVYDYVNHVLPFDIKENGQENLMPIQYFGRGGGDEAPDRYMPHCDGECGDLNFKLGNRMATMVMYCAMPYVGGVTNFRNSGVHIKPKQYSATFFSYIDPVTMKMDDGFTEHSGFPLVEGEKKIVTQLVLLGVDDANPWNSFNTLGIKYSDAANQQVAMAMMPARFVWMGAWPIPDPSNASYYILGTWVTKLESLSSVAGLAIKLDLQN